LPFLANKAPQGLTFKFIPKKILGLLFICRIIRFGAYLAYDVTQFSSAMML
jgi:hypothetical protein